MDESRPEVGARERPFEVSLICLSSLEVVIYTLVHN